MGQMTALPSTLRGHPHRKDLFTERFFFFLATWVRETSYRKFQGALLTGMPSGFRRSNEQSQILPASLPLPVRAEHSDDIIQLA